MSISPACLEPSLCPSEKKKHNFKPELMPFSQGDCMALVMVHFGTTHDDTRERSIEALNHMVRQHYPHAAFAEAYTSRIIINRLKERGVHKPTPAEVFSQLQAEGYTHLLIQSTHIIDGVEMESLRREVEAIKGLFKEVRLGRPLLYSPEDYEATIDALAQTIRSSCDAVLLVGHGTYTPITASYAMMDYMLKAKGYQNWCVATIENYPSLDEARQFLRQRGAKSVLLVPFMFVAGEHAKEDIAGEWKETLEAEGYDVQLWMQGMGENAGIQNLFLQHLRFAECNKELDIMSKKHMYAMGH